MGRFFLKWLGGAALAGALGYLVLGPKLAGDPKLKRLVQQGAEAVVSKAAPETKNPDDEPVEEEAPPAKPPTDAPKVRVGVRPVGEAPRRR